MTTIGAYKTTVMLLIVKIIGRAYSRNSITLIVGMQKPVYFNHGRWTLDFVDSFYYLRLKMCSLHIHEEWLTWINLSKSRMIEVPCKCSASGVSSAQCCKIKHAFPANTSSRGGVGVLNTLLVVCGMVAPGSLVRSKRAKRRTRRRSSPIA